MKTTTCATFARSPHAAEATCPRDNAPRNEYFCITFCGYCVPRGPHDRSFVCAYQDRAPHQPLPLPPVLPAMACEW